MICQAEPLDFGVVVKHPSERLTVVLDFEPNLTRYREPGELYRMGDIVRPRHATGFAYRALADGTTRRDEPAYKVALGAVTRDGTVQWETITANHEGIDIIIGATASIDGIDATAQVVGWEGAELSLVLEGGADLADYLTTVTVTTQSNQILAGVIGIEIRSMRAVRLCL